MTMALSLMQIIPVTTSQPQFCQPSAKSMQFSTLQGDSGSLGILESDLSVSGVAVDLGCRAHLRSLCSRLRGVEHPHLRF